MKLEEALKSKLHYRRPGGEWSKFADSKYPCFTVSDILASDWEVKKKLRVYGVIRNSVIMTDSDGLATIQEFMKCMPIEWDKISEDKRHEYTKLVEVLDE